MPQLFSVNDARLSYSTVASRNEFMVNNGKLDQNNPDSLCAGVVPNTCHSVRQNERCYDGVLFIVLAEWVTLNPIQRARSKEVQSTCPLPRNVQAGRSPRPSFTHSFYFLSGLTHNYYYSPVCLISLFPFFPFPFSYFLFPPPFPPSALSSLFLALASVPFCLPTVSTVLRTYPTLP